MLLVVPRHPVVPPELTKAPFSLVEAQMVGITRSQLQGKSWRRLGAGLHAWPGLPNDPTLVLAAVRRRLPAEAAFSGRTAAWLHGLDIPPCGPVVVTIPEGAGVSARTGVSIRRAALADRDVVLLRGLRATSALRTVVDLACMLSLEEAVVAAYMALHKQLIQIKQLRAYTEAHLMRKGVKRLRQVIDLAEPAAESAMETRMRLLLVLAGLPRPKAQVTLVDVSGRFVGRPDLYYPAARLALEYDGAIHRDSLVADDRRQNALINAGYRLLRFTASDVHRHPDSVVAQVRAALTAVPPA